VAPPADVGAPQPPHLAHHFADLDQQHQANTLGMWLFLATEILFFGALFAGYTVYRARYPRAFEAGSRHLVLTIGAVNTAVLIGSSLTVVLAIHAARGGARRLAELFLVLTMLLGAAFLGLKVLEYYIDWKESLVMGPGFGARVEWEKDINLYHVQLFFSFYYVMTGLHACHMVVGLGVFLVLWRKTRQGRYTPQYTTPLEVGGLYWHFVDIVWVFLFPLLYLIRH
jgi:cytochrome c oxidase subunit 3